MSTTLKMVACINCNLKTRADRKMCQHGNHFRDERTEPAELHSHPTSQDREDYFLWLSQQGAQLMLH